MPPLRLEARSAAERSEMMASGLLSAEWCLTRPPAPVPRPYESVPRKAIEAPSVLNEAFDYPRPSSFSRGLRVDRGDYRLLQTVAPSTSIWRSGSICIRSTFTATGKITRS